MAIGQYEVPIQAVQTVVGSEALVFAADWGRDEFALAQIDSLRATVEEPWRFVLSVAAVQVQLDREDIAAAQKSVSDLRALDQTFGGDAPSRLARIRWAEGRIAELEDGDCRRALTSYQAARELLPQSTTYRAWLAACLTSLEHWEEAEPEIAWLLERFPGSPKIRQLAGWHYAERGRVADAIAELEIALDYWSEADPDYRPAQEARSLLEELRARS